MEKKKIAANVMAKLDECSAIVGKFSDDSFHSNTWSFFIDNEVNSPIEQILYSALETVREINYIDKADPVELRGKTVIRGLGIIQQYKIDKYRVDFLVYYESASVDKKIIVECDSQQFHERDEKERRYEKERDRFLQIKGYKVFRYTGSEIVKEPFRIAAEIIAHVTEIAFEHLYDLNYLPELRK